VPSLGEVMAVQDAGEVLMDVMNLTLGVPVPNSGSVLWGYDFIGAGSYQVVDWGDGSDAGNYHPLLGTAQATSHSYSNALSGKNVRLFHNDTLISLFHFAPVSGGVYTIYKISGKVPISVTKFLLVGQVMQPTCDMSCIWRLMNLQQFELIASNTVEKFSPALFGTAFSGVGINYILLAQNKLLQPTVDICFNNFVLNNPGFVSGGTFDISNQIPMASPTVASDTARAALISAGWTVVTD
jgi:hypothetical protein